MEEKSISDYEAKINAEIEKRISEMESSEYVFPKKFSKTDYIITAAVGLFCLAMIIAGAFL